MLKYDTFLFDLDGTLLDSLDDIAESTNYALVSCGFPPRSRDEIRRFAGQSTAEFLLDCMPEGVVDPPLDRCLELYGSRYASLTQSQPKLFPGVLEFLEQLSRRGCRLGVVTNKFEEEAIALSKALLSPWIQVAVGESELVKVKPDPSGVTQALQRLEASPQGAVYVGDTEIDIRTAKNAGIASIGVTWGFRERHALEREGADHIVDSLSQLME